MNGFLPLALIETFFRCRLAASATRLPVMVEPVKCTIAMCGSVSNTSASGPSTGMQWNRPSGNPASSRIRAKTIPEHMIALRCGLSTTALPMASAGAMKRDPRISGTFDGVMPATTP